MLNSTSTSMVSALAGLQRLEAQIYQAMMEAGGAQATSNGSSAPASPNPENLLKSADDAMAAATQSVTGLDLTA